MRSRSVVCHCHCGFIRGWGVDSAAVGPSAPTQGAERAWPHALL